jgi:hypothetical protein
MVFKFARQLQQMSSINGARRPLNQRTILVEMGDITQPLGTRLLIDHHDVWNVARADAATHCELKPL